MGSPSKLQKIEILGCVVDYDFFGCCDLVFFFIWVYIPSER